jgi:hypothetical protein
MGKRGGPRSGAGRPSPLSKVERLLIGARCEKRWRELCEAEAIRRHHEKNNGDAIEEKRRILARVPLRDRAVVINRASSEKLPFLRDLWGETQRAVEALHSLQWDLLNGRQRFIAFKSPQGFREAVIGRIARSENKNRKLRLTRRQIERWWDDYRGLISGKP